jgi:hypothetical protein
LELVIIVEESRALKPGVKTVETFAQAGGVVATYKEVLNRRRSFSKRLQGYETLEASPFSYVDTISSY